MLTQVYEVTDPATARAIAAIGVDHIGAKVGDGSRPRELTVAAARAVMAAVGPRARFCALFMSADVDAIAAHIAALLPPIVHLGAAPEAIGPDDMRALKARFPGLALMRSLPVGDEASVALAVAFAPFADFLMLDSVRPGDGKIGALGVTHDWALSRRIVEAVRCPVLLAGGLGPDNVAAAIRAVRPAGVDSKTRTDIDGGHAKDLDKVRRYHEAAKREGARVAASGEQTADAGTKPI
ncbi:phosphoribosylanthranilate isomerase [Prosthecomicrobium pneumaticum]|uniref:N-(5'-phosphoribosyl)anthranilate isomerase n=1 Tax=Prosthecomicrobium pneumaticum TaxID=81895 RepID=A0A7W9FM13_9HYPH|nr:phosphoribosylanthranilate isomerase [Prosthecomicrobium pneumaticum]